MPVENHEESCILVLATDVPLTSRQCERLAKRCSLGLAVIGSYASDGSGEIMVAFTTAHRVSRASAEPLQLMSVANEQMQRVFEAAVDATAESVVSSLCSAHTTVGRDAQVAHSVPLDRLVAAMRKCGREMRSPDGA